MEGIGGEGEEEGHLVAEEGESLGVKRKSSGELGVGVHDEEQLHRLLVELERDCLEERDVVAQNLQGVRSRVWPCVSGCDGGGCIQRNPRGTENKREERGGGLNG